MFAPLAHKRNAGPCAKAIHSPLQARHLAVACCPHGFRRSLDKQLCECGHGRIKRYGWSRGFGVNQQGWRTTQAVETVLRGLLVWGDRGEVTIYLQAEIEKQYQRSETQWSPKTICNNINILHVQSIFDLLG